MNQGCDRWRGDVGLYIIGALDIKESVAMSLHLAICPACRAEYEEMLPVRDWLARTKQHLAICRACRADIQRLLRLGPLTSGPRAEDRGDG
jgi:predicted anti-sigma-YlaC factor YlaD